MFEHIAIRIAIEFEFANKKKKPFNISTIENVFFFNDLQFWKVEFWSFENQQFQIQMFTKPFLHNTWRGFFV